MTALSVINQAADKSYRQMPNVAPYPAAFCQVANASSADAPVSPPSRWIMISDTAAKVVEATLAGRHIEPNVITETLADLTMAADGVLTSTTSGKFASLGLGQPVQLKGFTNQQNNGLFIVGPGSTTTQLNLMAPGTTVVDGSSVTGGTPAYTVAENPTGGAASITGPDVSTQDTITFTALPGVMYPISVDAILHSATTAATVLCFW
jgi:hypothetical protein